MKTLLLLGDSLIEYGDWQSAFPAGRCLNLGIAGETVEGLLQRLPTVIKRVGVADAVVVMTGTNNLAMDDLYFVPEYEKILLQLISVTQPTKILVTSLLPVDFPWQPSTLVPNLNAHLKKMCSRQSARYLDLYGPFLAAITKGLAVFAEDGVHLNTTGYEMWRAALLEFFPWLR